MLLYRLKTPRWFRNIFYGSTIIYCHKRNIFVSETNFLRNSIFIFPEVLWGVRYPSKIHWAKSKYHKQEDFNQNLSSVAQSRKRCSYTDERTNIKTNEQSAEWQSVLVNKRKYMTVKINCVTTSKYQKNMYLPPREKMRNKKNKMWKCENFKMFKSDSSKKCFKCYYLWMWG